MEEKWGKGSRVFLRQRFGRDDICGRILSDSSQWGSVRPCRLYQESYLTDQIISSSMVMLKKNHNEWLKVFLEDADKRPERNGRTESGVAGCSIKPETSNAKRVIER
jgi:hypothetical protein